MWQGRKGVDVNPKADGPERREFLERIEMQPIDPQANGPQLLYGLRYHVHIVASDEDVTFHDQVGYWLWEPATGLIMQTLAIPRGQVALAAAAARFEGVVAWDAIDDGAALVRGLNAMQQALKLDLNRFDRARPALDVSAQWPGSDVSDTLRAQLAGLRLPPSPHVPVAWLASASEGDAHAGAAIEVEPRWDDIDRLELAILSHPLIDAARRHLREMA